MQIEDLALSFLKGIGIRSANALLEFFGSAAAFFKATVQDCRDAGLKPRFCDNLEKVRTAALRRAEKELQLSRQNGIRIICPEDADYPISLRCCSDAPLALYYRGTMHVNGKQGLAVVGTRRASSYGKEQSRLAVEGLAGQNIFTVSGLAIGIDTQAHQSSLESGLPTYAVLAHGLERVYPEENHGLAKKIIEQGGAILSEMPLHTQIKSGLFPRRNRIIAGMAQVTLVAEASMKGGAMHTAYAADSYQRSLFAVPGRNKDYYYEGCNYLIKTGRARLFQEAKDIRREMGLDDTCGLVKGNKTGQTDPYGHAGLPGFQPDLEQSTILERLKSENPASTDYLLQHTGLALPDLLSCLLRLELAGLVRSCPGGYYELAH